MIKAIHKILSAALSKRGLDWRSCYTRVHSEPPDGRTLRVECSDRRVLDDLKGALAEAGQDVAAVRFVSLPHQEARLPERYVVFTSVADLRKEPAHAAELITEYVMAMKHGIGLNKILATIHIYPTLSESNKFLAGEWRKARKPEKLLSWAEKYHRWARR